MWTNITQVRQERFRAIDDPTAFFIYTGFCELVPFLSVKHSDKQDSQGCKDVSHFKKLLYHIFFKNRPWLEAPANCSRISRHARQKIHRYCVDLVRSAICGCSLLAWLEVGGGRHQGQGKVSSEASALQREEVELAKPSLIWYVTKTSH